jgi:hypothetical protein
VTGVAADDTAERDDSVATCGEELLGGKGQLEGPGHPDLGRIADLAGHRRSACAVEELPRDVFVEARDGDADARAARRDESVARSLTGGHRSVGAGVDVVDVLVEPFDDVAHLLDLGA